ncbi:MAG: hypothetical protein S4CHLAM123_03670 [Chlamydiales bacterium]|nr:hypothetical protein [Chlamydiales bacterium]
MRWLGYINLFLAALIIACVGFFFLMPHEELACPMRPALEKKELPKSAFGASEEFFHEIGQELFTLAWVPPQMQLPDLREVLIFYKKNARPDYLPGKSSVQVALKDSDQRAHIQENSRLYLIYEGNHLASIDKVRNQKSFGNPAPLWGEISETHRGAKTTYAFSPENLPTPLWLEICNQNEHTVEVCVNMLDEKGALVSAPSEFHRFYLQPQDYPKAEVVSWELGGYRVDSTFLVRQKARWIGRDLFLELHGGEEYSHVIGAERIDFHDGEGFYSCFVKLDDFLVWKNNRWEVAPKGAQTQNLPLMVVKRIDDKLLNFEIWDPEGKRKLPLNLIRAREQHAVPNISQDFKFVGAKTWAQFTVECRNQGRMTLKPHDWLVCTQEGWQKLDTPEQIDAFVEQTLVGPLFVLDQMTKQNGRQVLTGHLFNATRTEVSQVELTAAANSPITNLTSRIPKNPPIIPKHIQMEGERE